MGGAVSAGEDNDELIDNLLDADYIKSAQVERVFRAVDRADYYTDEFKQNAYKDLAWKQGNLHLSAPCVYSEVVESLRLQPGLSFLNLGSGTGYLSTMVGLLIGPYGTNHGIEFHEDVVQYAYKKLEEFKQKSPAVDEYEFCEPKFVVGNCLCIHPNSRKYDRVYCGAACPEAFEQYMKELVKIGGILVMPLNDQLLQVTRRSATIWDVKTVLPVSFASLIMPKGDHGSSLNEPVKLPDSEPLQMQLICRSTIRSLLRKVVEAEHPELCTQFRRKPRRTKKQSKQGIVIPIIEESSDNEDPVPADVGNLGSSNTSGEGGQGQQQQEQQSQAGRRTTTRRNNVFFAVHQDPHQFTSFIQLARAIAIRNRQRQQQQQQSNQEVLERTSDNNSSSSSSNNSSTSNSSNNNNNSAGNSTSSTFLERVTGFRRRRNIDSGLGDEEEAMEVGEAPEQPPPPPPLDSSSAGNSSSVKGSVKGKNKRSSSSESTGNAGDNSDSDFSEALSSSVTDEEGSSSRRGRARKSRPSREKAESWKSLRMESDDSEEEDEMPVSCDCEDEEAEVEEEDSEEEEDGGKARHQKHHHQKKQPPREQPMSKYTAHMRSKILALPLPWSLKCFLNYNRDF